MVVIVIVPAACGFGGWDILRVSVQYHVHVICGEGASEAVANYLYRMLHREHNQHDSSNNDNTDCCLLCFLYDYYLLY